ncbi:MAG: Uma2 family endonuclease [Pyrinomonadaceae bacterium]|nr:Uma2 family endonuclease [Pyrinomonadaceae bacterium]
MLIVNAHPPPTLKERMTFEEFLALDDETTMSEWVDGEVIMMSPAAERHQELILFLAQTLGLYVQVHNLGRILLPPFAMKLEKGRRGREPDLIFVSRDRTHLIQRTYLDGPADLAVEIVSPESIGRDRGEKFVEYERAGIREYWLIDPDRETAEFYELGADGRYRAAATESDGVFRSKVIAGFFMRLPWLWQTPSPALVALRELKLI